MTEQEWLRSENWDQMYDVVVPHKSNQRRQDLFCLACVQLFLDLIEDREAKKAFEWLDEHVGERRLPKGGHQRNLFQGQAIGLYNAHQRREQSPAGIAVHIVYDMWVGWYEYVSKKLPGLYPGALQENPWAYLSSVIREMFGNPFRPVNVDPAWITTTVKQIATGIYDEKAFDRMPILADALEESGCTDEVILNHCRQPGTHVRGCWVIDLLLSKE